MLTRDVMTRTKRCVAVAHRDDAILEEINVILGECADLSDGLVVDRITDEWVVLNMRAASELTARWERFRALAARLSPAAARKMQAARDPNLDARMKVLAAELRAYRDWERAADRAARLAARPPEPDPVAETPACRECHRAARIDGLCKRHAHAAGLMPRGKIGEG